LYITIIYDHWQLTRSADVTAAPEQDPGWAKQQKDNASCSQAARRLIEVALTAKSNRRGETTTASDARLRHASKVPTITKPLKTPSLPIVT